MRCGLATAVASGVPECPLSGRQTGDRNGRINVRTGLIMLQSRVDKTRDKSAQ
jgi:hypothetical protein